MKNTWQTRAATISWPTILFSGLFFFIGQGIFHSDLSLPLDQSVQKLSIWYRIFRRKKRSLSWALSRDMFNPAISTHCADGKKLRNWFANVDGQCGGQKRFHFYIKGKVFWYGAEYLEQQRSSYLGYFPIGCRNLEARPVQKKTCFSFAEF